MHVYDNGQTGVGNGPKLQYLHHQRHIFALRQFVTADTIVTAADASWVTCQGSVSQFEIQPDALRQYLEISP